MPVSRLTIKQIIYYTLYYIDMSIFTQDMKDKINNYKHSKQIAKITGVLKEMMDSQAVFFENIAQYTDLYVRANLNNIDTDGTKEGNQNEDQTKYMECKATIEREIGTVQTANEEVLKGMNRANQFRQSVEPYTKQMGPLYNENNPKNMLDDITQLYNLQYLHLFCKFLGIVIILYMLYSFFSSRPSSSLSSATAISSPSLPSLPSVNV